ncbi:MAG TPA: hypothetical protein VF624_07785 [Tepidisphaeraceae bacterium]|jgi:hypothetical protein
MPLAKRSLFPLVWSLVAVAVVAGAAGLTVWLTRAAPIDTAAAAAATRPATVVMGRDYYVFLRLIEFKPRTQAGKTWDSGNGSAPDAAVTLYWRGNRIFELPERKDQLIATWDLFRVDVKDLVLSGGNVDVSGLLNAPLVKIEAADPITIEVYDDDPMGDDLAANLQIDLSTLSQGRNAITLPADSGLNRLEIELIDRQTPLPRLIELASGR